MGYEFFGEKIIFASAPVPGINNDQSLRHMHRYAQLFSLRMSLRAVFFSLRMLCIFCKLQLAHGEWRDQEVEEESCSTVSQAKTLRSLASKWREISQLLIRSFQRRRLQVNHKI